MTDFDSRRRFAIDLAVEAGALARSMRQGLGTIESKSSIDFCTAADLAVETLVRQRLADAFGDPVIGEEAGGEPADLVWVVDPIDGTTNYIHGTNNWCVSLALVQRGVVELGVIYAPDLDQLFVARRGAGATMNGRAIRTSGLRHGGGAVVEMGWSARRPLAHSLDLITRMIADNIEFRRCGSGAMGLANVALGVSDGYVELHINAWDALAGLLLVREAGGWTNDFLADDGLRQGNVVVACTAELTERLLALEPLRGVA